MRSLRVPDLYRNADAGHLNVVPIDVVRRQQPFGVDGVAVAFVDVRPRAGLAIINPAQRKATTDPTAADHMRGVVSSLPVGPLGKLQ